MISRKKVLISGAGVAGIVCAVLLDKEKYDVEIIERSETFRNIGFSLTVWKSGFSQLRSLFESYGEKLINKTKAIKAAAETENPLPIAAVELPIASKTSARSRVSAPIFAISAMPAALSAIGP